MKKILIAAWTAALILGGLAACQPKAEGPQIEISDAWGRPSPLASGNGAAYMLIRNTGDEDDRLLGVSGDMADNVELHDMTMENDVMKMFHIDGVDIPAGESIELKPGGKHVMLIGLHSQLEIGQVITINLEFEKSGTISVQAEIREP